MGASDSNSLLLTLIIFLPLAGFVINGLGFKKIPNALAATIGIGTVASAFLLALKLFFDYKANGAGQALVYNYYTWIAIDSFSVNFSMLIDPLSLVMLLLVTGVGSLIHIYSAGYMSHDEGFGKFFAFLNLFVFSMLLLVLGSNYVVMFIGWEGVGLCSFLLIGFWNKVPAYNAAARKAFVMNRIGDLGFLLGIFMIISNFGTVEYQDVFANAGNILQMNSGTAIAITMLLFVGAMGKSAQIPLYTWLPDAMAGPTPVSALIHAATMVTAGIYMVVRSNVLYVLAPDTLHFIAWIGLATALFAATIGLFQNDIKKVLAYSTVSQLGYMFLALGVGAFTSGMFHVLTHAFFKALLFLGAGSVIHGMHEEQDIRKMGALRSKMPVTFAVFFIACIAISGIPPFAGFFSKDEILAGVHHHSTLMWALGLVGSALTSFYMFRLLFLVFFGEYRNQSHYSFDKVHESPLVMTAPLMVLAVLSMIGGGLGLPEVFSETHVLNSWLAPIYSQAAAISPETFASHGMSHSEEFMLMGISVAVALTSMIVAYVVYVSRKVVPVEEDAAIPALQKVVYNKYYVDEIYDAVIVRPLTVLSHIFHGVVEFLFIDLIVTLIGRFFIELGGVVRKLQTGTIGTYVMIMVAGIATLLFFNLFI